MRYTMRAETSAVIDQMARPIPMSWTPYSSNLNL